MMLAMALCAPPSTAAAEAIVPPGNSAAAQYTETFPTAGGEKETGGQKKEKLTVGQALGERNARHLEAKGSAGKEVADFAAETSPAPVATLVEPSSGGGGDRGGGGKDRTQKAGQADHAGKGQTDGKGVPSAGNTGNGGPGSSSAPADQSQSAGSSGLGEVLGQATGSSSSGKLGLLLPLVIVGAVIGSLLYLWRQRQRVA
jgi:hypothetical protein